MMARRKTFRSLPLPFPFIFQIEYDSYHEGEEEEKEIDNLVDMTSIILLSLVSIEGNY